MLNIKREKGNRSYVQYIQRSKKRKVQNAYNTTHMEDQCECILIVETHVP